jgi:hypothetical protein
VAASVTTVVADFVEMLVSCTTIVTTVVYVVVVVEGATVVAPIVTVVGCGFRQLHALESLEAGCRSKFFLARSTQLGVALGTGVDTSRGGTSCRNSRHRRLVRNFGGNGGGNCLDRGYPVGRHVRHPTLREQLTYTTSIEVEIVITVFMTVSMTMGVSVLRWTVTGSMER